MVSGMSSLHVPCNVHKSYDVKYRQHRVMKKSLLLFFSALEAEPGRLKL